MCVAGGAGRCRPGDLSAGRDESTAWGHVVPVHAWQMRPGPAVRDPRRQGGISRRPRGQRWGIDRLWLADASVMPTIPAANTNLSAIVIAERIAQRLFTP